MRPVLDGLAAFESHRDVVVLLDRLVNLLTGDVRNQAILMLERKRLVLDMEKTIAVFQAIHSPYKISRVLGQGLFTSAYAAQDEDDGLDVVVRVLRAEFASQPQIRTKFLDLSRQARRFVHQNLVLTREVKAVPEHELYFVVRDHVNGVTLQSLIDTGAPFSEQQIGRILSQIVAALAPLHDERTAHGGIKPSNIFLTGGGHVVLGDPALPVPALGASLDRLSYDYRYAAPELFERSGIAGPSADLYAVGCIAHELTCGRPPFVADNPFELAGMHLHEQPNLERDPIEPFNQSAAPEAPGQITGRTVHRQRPGRPCSATARGPGWNDSLQWLRRRCRIAFLQPFSTRRRFRSFRSIPTRWRPQSVRLFRRSRVVGNHCLNGSVATRSSEDWATAGWGRSTWLATSTESAGGTQGDRGDVRSARARARAFPAREAEATARLTHPGIVQIYDLGRQDGVPYLTLEYVGGGSLSKLLRAEGPMAPERAARLVLQLAQAVHAAHDEGIIHRDLKPSNVLLTENGTPKISDFGLAKLVDRDRRGREDALTQPGQPLGTPGYMAPEQVRGELDTIGRATDVYGLGTILYECLTGRRPFHGRYVFGRLPDRGAIASIAAPKPAGGSHRARTDLSQMPGEGPAQALCRRR